MSLSVSADAKTATSNNSVPAPPEAAPEDNSGRDARGRFTKGNPGGPGNPFARRVAEMRKAMMDAVTPEDIAAIGKAMLAKAKEGDVGAARLVLSYIVGRPQAAEDPDRLDEKEWQQWRREVTPNAEVGQVLESTSAALACTIVASAMPGLQASRAEAIRDSLLAYDEQDDEEDDYEEEEQAQEAAPGESAAGAVEQGAGVDEAALLEELRHDGAGLALRAEGGDRSLPVALKGVEPTVTRRPQPDRRAANPPGQ
jgi:hypothetical protein